MITLRNYMTRNMTRQNKNRSTERFNKVELRGLEPTLKIAHTARFRTFKNLAHIFLYVKNTLKYAQRISKFRVI